MHLSTCNGLKKIQWHIARTFLQLCKNRKREIGCVTCAECALSWAAERRTRSGHHSHSRLARWGRSWWSVGSKSRGQRWVLRGNSHLPMTRRRLKGPSLQEGWKTTYLHTASLRGEKKINSWTHKKTHGVAFTTTNVTFSTYLLLMYNLISEQLRE